MFSSLDERCILAETIAAISTALGEGGIGIVRVSGPASLDIMRKMMSSCPDNVVPRHAYMAKVVDKDSKIIDEAVFLYMKSPASYTGEDMLEIQAHGSNVSLKEILRNVLACPFEGIRMAEPGEFTKLAFLNGKMDLSQAEAVIDIIKAKTDISLDIAEKQRDGRLSFAIKNIRESMLNILAQMAVNIDYPDEDIDQESYDELLDKLEAVQTDVRKLLETSSIGRIAREGIKIAIVGKPNVGKSSLMNAILGEGRVIVTNIPGTTRDTVEESASINGIPIVLVDTAGLRETDDVVEKIGIERTRQAISTADMVLFVVDGSEKFTDTDNNYLSAVKAFDPERVLVVINKSDLGRTLKIEEIEGFLPGAKIISTSLINESAIESAKIISEAIAEIFEIGNLKTQETSIVSNERHILMLNNADSNISDAISMIKAGEPLEVVELSAHYAYDSLGKIIGEDVGDEVLNTVFSKFCLGK